MERSITHPKSKWNSSQQSQRSLKIQVPSLVRSKKLPGFQEHDIAPLVAAKLLVPLGKPAANGPKYFAAVEIAERASNAEWLSSATKVLAKHWLRKNQRKQLNGRLDTSTKVAV